MLVCPMLNDARCWWALVATESAIATAAASAAVSPKKLCGSQWGRQKPFLLPPNGKMLREGCFLFLANDNRVVRILSVPRCLLFFGCLHESWPNRRRLWVALPALTELPFPQPQQWREDTACGIVINLPFGIVAILFIIHSCFPMYLYFLHKSKLVFFHSFFHSFSYFFFPTPFPSPQTLLFSSFDFVCLSFFLLRAAICFVLLHWDREWHRAIVAISSQNILFYSLANESAIILILLVYLHCRLPFVQMCSF